MSLGLGYICVYGGGKVATIHRALPYSIDWMLKDVTPARRGCEKWAGRLFDDLGRKA